MDALPTPPPEAVFYEDDRLYACLASYPLAKGHTVVAWKEHVPDLNRLSRADYDHLMETVDRVRDALMRVLSVEKVYLLYMDEARHVHWHLVPRFVEEGVVVFEHPAHKTADFSLAPALRKELEAGA